MYCEKVTEDEFLEIFPSKIEMRDIEDDWVTINNINDVEDKRAEVVSTEVHLEDNWLEISVLT